MLKRLAQRSVKWWPVLPFFSGSSASEKGLNAALTKEAVDWLEADLG